MLAPWLVAMLSAPAALAQEAEPTPAGPAVPEQVEVGRQPDDGAIAERLSSILEATGWYEAIQVDVRDGVAFLDGTTTRREWQEWAESMAANTEGVVAVVDRIELEPGAALDFGPALAEFEVLWRDSVQALPLVAVIAFVLLATWLLAYLVLHLGRRLLRGRMPSALLTNVAAWLLAAPIILIGIYVALRIAGLTQLALTVLGGTGLAGLIIGIAFRDIAENYLASILISVRNPFRTGDRIEVAGLVGIVQRVTTRGTILMTLDGNHLQIPNSTVYKSTITNYTANPSRRMDFEVGIGYDAAVPDAQAVIGRVLADHPAVLAEPEPLVLVEALGASTVNLRAYFWFNGTRYEGLKIKSSLIRLSKRALEAADISMPDEAREVIFPLGVPIVGAERTGPATEAAIPPPRPTSPLQARGPDPVSTQAEGGLRSEDDQIKEQAARARLPEEGADLLETAD